MVPAMKSVSSRLTMREMSGVSTEPNAQEHALRCLPACVIIEGQELLNTVLNSAPVSPCLTFFTLSTWPNELRSRLLPLWCLCVVCCFVGFLFWLFVVSLMDCNLEATPSQLK